MQIEVNEQFKFASVWLTNEEKGDTSILDLLKPVMEQYRAMKYKFVIFQSGTQSLLELTQDLLAHNKNLARDNKEKEADSQHEKKPSLHSKLESMKSQVDKQGKANRKKERTKEEVL